MKPREAERRKEMIKVKQCPRCETVAEGKREINKVFGYRHMKPGKDPVPQSYCRDCRKADGDEKRAAARATRENLQRVATQLQQQHGQVGQIRHAIPAPVVLGNLGAPFERTGQPDGYDWTRPPSGAPVVVPMTINVQAVPYGTAKHRPGDVVVVGKRQALYRVGDNGSITAIS